MAIKKRGINPPPILALLFSVEEKAIGTVTDFQYPGFFHLSLLFYPQNKRVFAGRSSIARKNSKNKNHTKSVVNNTTYV